MNRSSATPPGTDSDYDAFAAAYAADNERNAGNAQYERRAIGRRAAAPAAGHGER